MEIPFLTAHQQIDIYVQALAAATETQATVARTLREATADGVSVQPADGAVRKTFCDLIFATAQLPQPLHTSTRHSGHLQSATIRLPPFPNSNNWMTHSPTHARAANTASALGESIKHNDSWSR